MNEAPPTTSERGEMLVRLRHALRSCALLADQLKDDALVGCEARSLVGRLAAIRSELEELQQARPEWRRAENDPLWLKQQRYRH